MTLRSTCMIASVAALCCNAEQAAPTKATPGPATTPPPPAVAPQFERGKDPTDEHRARVLALVQRGSQLATEGKHAESLRVWTRAAALVDTRDSPQDAREIVWANAGRRHAEAFSAGVGGPNAARVAVELMVRTAAPELASFLEHAAEPSARTDQRFAILVADTHPEGTTVEVDDDPACKEPCLVAVPVDGRSHELRFLGGGATATLTWSPETALSPAPPVPQLDPGH